GLGTVLPPQEVIPVENGLRVKVNPLNHIIITLISELAAILFATYLAVCTTLLYFDLRIRKEGFDLELAAGVAPEHERDSEDDGRRDDERDYYEDRDRYEDERDRDFDDRPERDLR